MKNCEFCNEELDIPEGYTPLWAIAEEQKFLSGFPDKYKWHNAPDDERIVIHVCEDADV